MNPISMSTRDVRTVLREADDHETGLTVRVAVDIYGPGGSVFIAANSKLTERHLVWLTRYGLFPIIISHGKRSGRSAPDLSRAVESPDSAKERRRRADELSREVVVKADAVSKKATEVYRIVGESAFTSSALRNREVLDNLGELNERISGFHSSVTSAIDEYLVGSTLIMDLIARHDLASRDVQHGLNVAVFATELSSQVLLRGSAQRKGRLGPRPRSRGNIPGRIHARLRVVESERRRRGEP